tara:strand:+ start:2798 stop:3481 length:684 start_codon:yes stop_codon:yes gene_type:complete
MSFSASSLAWRLNLKPSSAKFVLLCLANRSCNKGNSWPSVNTIAKDTGLDRKTIMSAVAILETDNLLEVDRSSGSSNKYQINLSQLSILVKHTSPDINTSTSPDNGIGDMDNQYQKRDLTSTKNGTDQSQKRDTNLSITNKESYIDKKPNRKVGLPSDFICTEEFRNWCTANGHSSPDKHFDNFVLQAEARGYKYVNWMSALKRATKDNWAKVEKQNTHQRAGAYVP